MGGIDGSDLLVRAYSAKDGELLWGDLYDRAARDDTALGITLAETRVFAMGTADAPSPFFRGIPLIRAYDSRTGRLLWQHEVTDVRGVFDSAVVHAQIVVAVGGNTSWLVDGVDVATGAVRWSDRFGVEDGNRAIGVAEHHGHVFVAGRARPAAGVDLDWFVRAYDALSGTVLWDDYAPAGIGGRCK